ncbi:MAG: hypothetical protein BWX48_03159 [Verrucomicrobia bacterium ADurb.Bin006]|jgi:hypothetical protein|nr:MAG: hypothetical protein BWX48_03159 [Verrucomicrobia bacterium ADurb.Bin006]
MRNRCPLLVWLLCGGAWLLLSGMGDGFAQSAVTQPRAEIPALQIISRVVRTNRPGFLSAIYAEPKGVRLFGFHSVSDDNGRGWSPLVWQPDFTANLPHGYRREPVTAVLDPHTDRLLVLLNSLDTPGLDPNAIEPPIAQETYYLRYRVSTNGGRSWRFEEPIIQTGNYNAQHPVAGVWVGKNAIYLGDV